MTKTISVHHKQKTDTSTNWSTNNPILLSGEIGYDSDTHIMKVGDGTNHWNDLSGIAASTAGMANTSLSNLTDTGKNISNWSSNVTDSIVEIQQDIQLALNGGVYVKAGSKIYYPDGTSKTRTTDTSVMTGGWGSQNETQFVMCNSDGSLWGAFPVQYCQSGATLDTTKLRGSTTGFWYDTTNNVIKFTNDGGSTFTSGHSLPLGIVTETTSSNIIDRIDQVFNGFGYIGSTLFMLPGVKLCIPYGRNSDGTLNNAIRTVSSVKTTTDTSGATGGMEVIANQDSISRSNYGTYYYDSEKNLYRVTSSGNAAYIVYIDKNAYRTSGKVTTFNPKRVLRLADNQEVVHINDTETIIGDKTFSGNTKAVTKSYTSKDTSVATTAFTHDFVDTLRTNCIVEVPQDIKLTLSGTTLTLASGSKIYSTDGNFTPHTLTSNVTNRQALGNHVADQEEILWVLGTGTLQHLRKDHVIVRDSNPSGLSTSGTSQYLCYNTTDWKTYWTADAGTTWSASTETIPIAIITVNADGTPKSIKHIFNGIVPFGARNMLLFILPGVKALLANGRNADGTLKNTLVTVNNLLKATGGSRGAISQLILHYDGASCQLAAYRNQWEYNPELNYFIYKTNGDRSWIDIGTYYYDNSLNYMTEFTVKNPFMAVDYSDYNETKNAANLVYNKQDTSTAINFNNSIGALLEVPQDIKITYSGSSLTIKSGSKIYYPNGANTFSSATLSSDESVTLNGTDVYYLFRRNAPGTAGYFWATLDQIDSGSDASSANNLFYDTTNNRIDWYTNGTRGDRLFSFPLCRMVLINGQIQELKIFNGFGYIGRKAYVLPGVKGIASNGRNSNGTHSNITYTISSVKLTDAYTDKYLCSSSGITPLYYAIYEESETQPKFKNGIWYKPSENKLYQINSWVASSAGNLNYVFDLETTSSKGTNIKYRYPLQLVDNNDFQDLKSTSLTTEQISECITQLPNTLNAKISNHVLYLYNGSIAYLGNGSPIKINSDLSYGVATEWGNVDFVFAVNSAGTGLVQATLSNSGAYSTNPGTSYKMWFNTSDSKCYINDGSGSATECSLPIAVVTHKNGVGWTNIKYLFNGMGFIGTTVFALPGIKALAPNGRNTDSSPRFVTRETTKTAFCNSLSEVKGYTLCLNEGGGLSPYFGKLVIQEDFPENIISYRCWYKPSLNLLYSTGTGDPSQVTSSVRAPLFYFNSTTKEFIPQIKARAVDFSELPAVSVGSVFNQNEASTIKHVYDWVGTLAEYNSQRIATIHPQWVCYITDDTEATAYQAYTKGQTDTLLAGKADTNLSNIPSNIDYIIESQLPTSANNYTWYRKYKSGWVEQGGVKTANGSGVQIDIPVTMSDANYTVFLTPTANESNIIRCFDRNVAYIKVATSGNTLLVSWEVKGMAA